MPIIPAVIAFGIAVLTQSQGEDSIDRHLKRWEQDIPNDALAIRWQKQVKNCSLIEKRWQMLATSLVAKYPTLLQEELKKLWPEQDLRLNPWGPLDQETNFIPPFDQVKFPFGPAVDNYGGAETKRRVPSLFRLAELLGLGTNVLKLEAWRIDPSFHAHGNRDFAIVSRARNDIVAIFQHHEAATEIETLRLSVESRLPTGYAILRMGPEVPLRKFGIEYIDFHKDYSQGGFQRRAWDRQQLGSLVTEHAIQILPSQAQQRARNEAIIKLRKTVRSSLEELQKRLLQRLDPAFSSKMASLAPEIESLKHWEQASISNPESHHWSDRLIAPSGALDAMTSQGSTASPSDFVTQLAQSQSRLALQALLNGLRRQLPDELQASANERYFAFIIKTRAANKTTSHGDPFTQSDH